MNFPILQTINLQKDNDVLEYKQGLSYGDNKAHEWLVTIKNGESTEVDLDSVAVTGYFLRADHVSVRVPGTIKNGVCSVVLDKRCYLVEGRVSAVMVLSRGEEIVTSAKMRTYAEQNITDQIIDTGDTIPTDIYDLLAQIDAMKEATKSTVAATTSANAAAERANAAAKRAEDLQIDANGLAGNALKLGGHLPEYYANQEQLSQLSQQIAAIGTFKKYSLNAAATSTKVTLVSCELLCSVGNIGMFRMMFHVTEVPDNQEGVFTITGFPKNISMAYPLLARGNENVLFSATATFNGTSISIISNKDNNVGSWISMSVVVFMSD